jgi:hypothetical protein
MAASAWGSLLGANVLIWIGIALCITQSAIFSGLNLAIFSVSKLRLEVEVTEGNPTKISSWSGASEAYNNRVRSLGAAVAWNSDARRGSKLDYLERHYRQAVIEQ